MRYARQIVLPEIGTQGQKQLNDASVLCVGAGGLGSAALLYLAAAGVGRIGVVDGDKVALHNLQRQILYCEEDCKKPKSTTAISHLKELNSTLTYEHYDAYLNANNALTWVSRYDYILDCADNTETSLLLNDACHFLNKTLISASVEGFKGQLSVLRAPGACLRCLFPSLGSALLRTCDEIGVLGLMPGILGSMQALEALKLILGLEQSLQGMHLTFDALSLQTAIYHLVPDPDCILCTKKATFVTLWQNPKDEKTMHPQQITGLELAELLDTQPEQIFLLDVRNEDEHAAFNIGGHLIPLAILPESLAQIPEDKPIVVYCRSGHRSQLALEFLQQRGFLNVRNLVGGVLAWPSCANA